MNSRVANLELALAPETSQQGEELVVDNAVVTAATLPERAKYAELSVKTNAVRYTLDGTDPVSSGRGAILATGVYTWSKRKLAAAKFIESVAGSDGVIHIQGMWE